jgi:protein involved in polysaccharide export with SLBB domain
MKGITLFFIAGLSLALGTLGHGQMSTFPAPPPLAPPPDRGSDDTTNSAASMAPAVDLDETASANSKKGSEPSSATGSNSTNPPASPPTTAATLSSMTALDDKVPLEAGDTISFRVIEDRDQAISRIVTDTGEVDFPYIGRVKVEGKTCHQVAVDVKRLLEVDYYKHATVIVGLDLIIGADKEKPHDMAWVVGQVRDVGPQELSKVQTITVSQVILRAGGLGEFADARKVKLIHRASDTAKAGDNAPPDVNSKDSQVIDVKAVYDGKSSVDPIVRPGDYIIVPKQWVNF